MHPARRLTFGDIIREHRRSFPDAVALVDGDVRLTWPRAGRAHQPAGQRARGRGRRARATGSCGSGQNSFRVYELLGAAAKIGAMVCPGYWRWAAPEMAFAVGTSIPKVVVWQDEEIGDTVGKARAELGDDHRALWLRHDTEERRTATSPSSPRGIARGPRPSTSTRTPRCWSSTPPRSPDGSAARCSRTATCSRWARSAAWMGDIDARDGLPRRRTDVPHRQLPVLGRPGLRARRQERRSSAGSSPRNCCRCWRGEHCTHAYLMPPTIAQLVAAQPRGGPRPVAACGRASPPPCGRAPSPPTRAGSPATAAARAGATGRPR